MKTCIHSDKPQVDLFKFFWRELELLGARVYESEDYENAIKIVSSGGIDCDAIITDVQDLENIGQAFASLSGNTQAMKSLIKCS